MIKLENTAVFNIARAVYSARNAMNSWDKSDSDLENDILGENDLKLAQSLAHNGSDHRKFLRQIMVSVDITAPLYWWKEFDTYKVGTVANSCSTMHTIHKRDLTLDDFSLEHTFETDNGWITDENGTKHLSPFTFFEGIVFQLNVYRKKYLATNDKKWWYQMIQLLPSSYNQMRTVTLNYEVLLNQYHARNAHKLDEWHIYCDWIESLPYFKEICL